MRLVMYIKEEFAVWFVSRMLCMLASVCRSWSCYSCRKLIVITYSITQPSFLYFTLLSMGFYTSYYMVWSINCSAFSTSVSLSNLRSKANCRIVFLCISLVWQFESHLVKYHSWNRTLFIWHDK